AIAGSGGAARTLRPPVSTKGVWTQDDARLLTRDDEEFGAARELISQRDRGAPVAEHESEILDAWAAGLPVAQIEAETLLSGAIYRQFIEGSRVSTDDRDRLARWRSHRAAHVAQIVARAAELTGGQGQELRAADGSRDWELYWDPELFNQLSSAFQQRLRRVYGARTGARRAGLSVAAGAEAPSGVLPNVLVNNPAADTNPRNTQSETSLVLGTGSIVLSSFNDSGLSTGGQHFTGIARSTDGGSTFTDLGALPVSTAGDAGDPVYARNNATGRILLATLDFTSGATLQCFRSDDDGATYALPVNCAAGGGSHDKEWITCDNAAGTGQGNFYNFWRDFGGGGGMTFTRSTDGGLTWGSRQVLDAAAGQGAWVVTGADHAIYAFWLKSGPNRIVVRKSTDLGLTFGAQITAQTLTVGGVNGDLGLGSFRSNAFPQVAAHPTDPFQLYMTWNDDGPGADRANVYFSHSSDGGATWTPRELVNTDAGTNDNWQPVIAVNPAGTRLFLSWYDRREDGANTLINVYGRNAAIVGTTVLFGADYRITDTAFPVVVGVDPAIVGTYMGDYDQAVADGASFYRTWGDNRSGSPDVRLSEIPADEGFGPYPRAGSLALGLTGCAAANGVADPGEVLTADLTVRNDGTDPLSNLVGTLQASGGVLNPSAPRTYGAIAPGASATRRFSFAVGGACGDNLLFSLQLQDGVTAYGVVTFGPLQTGLDNTVSFTNSAAITINDNAAGSPYPSTLTVSGISAYDRLTLDLRGFSHTFPDDVDVIVVAPTGVDAYVLSDVGGGTDVSGLDLTFDDAAGGPLTTAVIVAGTFKPSNLDTTTDAFPVGAPAGPYDATFAALSALGAAANGTWSLFVRDDVGTDAGSISNGWRLNVKQPRICDSGCGNALFSDDFESQDACRWSAAPGSTPSC
ncbi:MAG: hypothetical protein ABIV06_04420, partial [Thermoanaerobaculia bacterium]